MQRLLDNDIATRRGIQCAHLEPAYEKEPWSWAGKHHGQPPSLRESERARDDCLLLPLFHDIEERDLTKIRDALDQALRE